MSPPSPLVTALSSEEAAAAIDHFCEFLKFETVSTIAAASGQYSACAAWLLDYCQQTKIFDQVFYLPEAPADSPVVVAIWKGQDESLPILLLNSHYDVVPATRQDWSVPPFDAVRKDGKIYGRGTQDMKCVAIQYVEAIRKIMQLHQQQQAADSFQPQRNVVLTFVPDEEVGGAGMAAFLESKFYQSLPGGIALALDEGLASTTESFSVFYGERIPWFIDVTARGRTGHGSRFIEETAVEQIIELANKALAFRQGQRDKLLLSDHENCVHAVTKKKNLGDVTSLNITTLQAGVQVGNTFAFNCVPPVAKCSLDIRITPHTDPQEIEDMLDTWCRECSHNEEFKLEWTYIGRGHDAKKHALTSCDPQVNPWYNVFASAMADMNLTIEPSVFPAATDSRFLRALGVRALGFSPMRSTAATPCEILLHENDECIPEATFIEGIGVYVGIIRALASQKGDIDI
jgi:aminoacylase